jgi:Holliday junction resolvase-like predicted endonuclease
MTPRQCEIAAESYTACLLAQAGYDVLVQYGANQPHYDLVAVKDKRILPISVKGSQDGGWMLAVRYVKEGVNYHAAIDQWLSNQRDDVIYVFVQFKHVLPSNAPRVFVARPRDIALHMKTQCAGRGHGSLQEDYRRDHPRSQYDHKVPSNWNFTYERIDAI